MSRSKVVKVALRRVVRAAGPVCGSPFFAAALAALAAAAAVVVVVVVVVIPALTAVANMPGQFGHAYMSYYNDVGRQVQQARQQGGEAP